MRIDLTLTQYVSPKHLAEALARAQPVEFKAVFLALYEIIGRKDETLDAFAEALAQDLGGNAKGILRDLEARITYFEGANVRQPKREGAE